MIAVSGAVWDVRSVKGSGCAGSGGDVLVISVLTERQAPLLVQLSVISRAFKQFNRFFVFKLSGQAPPSSPSGIELSLRHNEH
jgi:hypothetical protein